MKAIFRRVEPRNSQTVETEPEYLSSGQITADLTNYHEVTVDDRPIELTPKRI